MFKNILKINNFKQLFCLRSRQNVYKVWHMKKNGAKRGKIGVINRVDRKRTHENGA